MSFDAIGFFQHYNITYITEGHKHCTQGWVQVKCPFCRSNSGWHLGFDFDKSWWNCWRCGYHRTWDVVLALLDGNKREATEAVRVFKGRPVAKRKRARQYNRELELPPDLQPLTKSARKYLLGRNFDPDMLEAIWRIQSTSNIGNLKYRIFIPIYVNNIMVSWQCRDITDKSKMKYLAQEESKEIINNKDTLYGLDQATGQSCVVVEGVTDVWRLGPGAVAVFGIKYRPEQVITLIENFQSFNLLFDPEPQAKIQAGKLAADLVAMGGKVKIWEFEESDPGDMSQEEADAFMREALGHGSY